jgi:hypothetical protein
VARDPFRVGFCDVDPDQVVNGVYGAAGAGVAVGPGAGGVVLTNQNGAVLTLAGRQAGLIVAATSTGWCAGALLRSLSMLPPR